MPQRLYRLRAYLEAALSPGHTSLTRWGFHPQGQSTTRGFVSPSPARATYSHHEPWLPSRPCEGRPSGRQQERLRNANRSVIISGLGHGVSVTELLKSIARTAPVGAISSAFLLPRQSRHAYHPSPRAQSPLAKDNMLGAGAKVSFNQRGSAMELIRLAREKVFRVGNRTPYVTEDRKGILRSAADVPPPLSQYLQTRVLVLEGSRHVEGFDEATIRRLLRSDAAAMTDAGPYGDLSEPVITRSVKGSQRRMEWRFFSYSAQALPFKKAIRAHFGDRLSVRHGRDPCCSVQLWEKDRRRNQEHTKAVSGAKRRRMELENPMGSWGEEGGSRSLEDSTEAPKLATEYLQEEGRTRSLESPTWAWQSATEHTWKEGRLENATVALDTVAEQTNESIGDKGREHIRKEEHLADELVNRETAVEQSTKPTADQGWEQTWKKGEHLEVGLVSGETTVANH